MYVSETRGVRVQVRPEYVPERSDPPQARYFWAYTVEITNMRDGTIRLRSRYWRIVDANGLLQEVRGPGVVGENSSTSRQSPPGGSVVPQLLRLEMEYPSPLICA